MRMCTFLVTLLALVIRSKGRLTSIGSYSNGFGEDDCLDGSCSLYAEKRMMLPEKVVEQRRLMPRSVNSAESFTQWRAICGCVTEYNMVDLGEGHYPRYITTARCKTKTGANKFYQCNYLDYRIYVLVKRGLSSILKNKIELDGRDVEVLPLPESLNDNWQLYALSVPAACVAAERS